jgi:hypothetical protein
MRLLASNGKDSRLVWVMGSVLGLAFWLGLIGLWFVRH